jgi:hypothetical protein
VQKRTRSILTELDELLTHKDKENILESRANNVINSAINILKSIHETYESERAGELERRFLNAIRGRDPKKFSRGVKKIRDEN